MELNKAKIGTCIKFTNKIGTYAFIEGDDVVCIAEQKRYFGIITYIGTCQEAGEEFQVIRIATSDMIKIDDITNICKNPLTNTTIITIGELLAIVSEGIGTVSDDTLKMIRNNKK